MPQFLAQCPLGLEEVLNNELTGLGIKKITKKIIGGIFFEGPWKDCYKANLYSKISSRILLTILDFPAYQNDEIYQNIRKHDFTKYILPEQTLKIYSQVKESVFKDQRFVSLKIKDAIVDQFRDKYGIRPSVDKENADLAIYVKVYKNKFSVSIDTTGVPLFKRGYRKDLFEAPLKENLANGLIKLTEWTPEMPLVDLMCGSGTFLIEAALNHIKYYPHRKYLFQNFIGYKKDVFSEVQKFRTYSDCSLILKGFDIDKEAIFNAKKSVQFLGLENQIEFINSNFFDTKNSLGARKGIIICNPPYGERLELTDSEQEFFYNLGKFLKENYKGWKFWLLSPNADAGRLMHLKCSKKIKVFNGPIECRFLQYPIEDIN